MTSFKDFSNFKNNHLKYYFFQKALENYSNHKKSDENIPRLRDNIIFTTFFTYLISEYKCMILLRDYNLILYLLIVIIIYVLGIIFYFVLGVKMYKNITKWLEKAKINFTTNPDKLLPKEKRTREGFLNTFNHDVSDQIALAIDITNHINEINSEVENQFYVVEAFQYTKKATYELYSMLISTKFKEYQECDGRYALIKKYRITSLIPLIEKLTDQINSNLKNIDNYDDFQQDFDAHQRKLSALKSEMLNY